ncbi:FAD-binding oxidoreductase [Halorhabdus sp. CBA1104]|uniref:FAD-binding and (Fe-S)-binding domain-containing protein n=1 Tax=unclassified Halorhabdus TaxID=2621901 RepID=UPI0012B2F1A8|nr:MULTISPECIES: FAD-binding and (Fe-S)-binding domain-containing protein [unclassified Halorhabdus]QGN07636.1 FAD-binding oxidoreductase [Halorhabdus sp. CBA1104]
MGTSNQVGPGVPEHTDPATDVRADYDYTSEEVQRPGLVADLRERIDGDVRFDEYSRELYATDASAYEVLPIGVVFPTSTADVASVVEYCAQREIPVLPRGGGTSLAGQTVNEAVVLDFTRYMDSVLETDPENARARVQAGTYIGDMNKEFAEHDLKFAPDPAYGDKSAVAGAIGNNSTGSHSLKYGKTDAYVDSVEVVLADGTVTEFGEVTLEELQDRADPDGDLESRIYAEVDRILEEEADTVDERFPDLKRNVSGYNLDRLIEEAAEGTVNLARLLAGSEGTLAVITEAEVSLEPVPETKSIALLAYEDLVAAMEDVAVILEHDPSALEVLDETLLELAGQTEDFGPLVAEMVPEGTGAMLLVEFYAETDQEGRQKVADLIADRVPDGESELQPSDGATEITDDPHYAFDAQEAHADDERKRFWKLRKSGNPILLGRTTDAKHISFIEDTAVPPENLPEYVADFQELLEDVGTFAAFYAHAGPGCLHIRPLVNTKTTEGMEQFEAIAEGATDLVVEYGGSVSGEHGDGRARSQFNRKLYGDDLWETFEELKTAFDPDWLLNPGNICGDHDMTEHLRFSPDYDFELGFEPTLNWDNDNGMQGMVELCHGCGGCRGPQDTTGGVMCPTFRASEEEITSTRGRANMLRQAMSGDLPDDVTDEEFVTEVLDLCIGCKGCAKDCPSEVDMAKLKAEVVHQHHQEHGSSLRDKLFANVDRLFPLGSALAPVSNWAQSVPGASFLQEKLLGIARERSFPTFYRETFVDWFADRGPQVPIEEAKHKVLLFPDTFSNYNRPQAGKAAVEVLEAAGVHVEVPAAVEDSGRAAHSKGFLDMAREHARENVDTLAPRVAEGWDVVSVEPSVAVMFQLDYLDLLSGSDVETLAENAYGVFEYLETHGLVEQLDVEPTGETLTYHGHCQQKAVKKDHHTSSVLSRVGFAVDHLDSGCCGMAGSFGYEAEHYSLSQAVGQILFDQIESSPGERVIAPGASCRHQIGEGETASDDPPHPVEVLATDLVA